MAPTFAGLAESVKPSADKPRVPFHFHIKFRLPELDFDVVPRLLSREEAQLATQEETKYPYLVSINFSFMQK